jgi:hypothetical protein
MGGGGHGEVISISKIKLRKEIYKEGNFTNKKG